MHKKFLWTFLYLAFVASASHVVAMDDDDKSKTKAVKPTIASGNWTPPDPHYLNFLQTTDLTQYSRSDQERLHKRMYGW